MSPHNPYAAPQAPARASGVGADGSTYVPPGWRTTLAALAVAGVTVSSVVLHALRTIFGSAIGSKNLTLLFVWGVAGLGIVVSLAGAAVFVCLWIHRAASNLRGLGRHGMRNTPGACVAGFFLPIASLWMPLGAMTEIWRASDPECGRGDWMGAKVTPLLSVWWSCWLGTFAVDIVSRAFWSAPSSEGVRGLVADVPRVVAAVAFILLMRGIDARQERIARSAGV